MVKKVKYLNFFVILLGLLIVFFRIFNSFNGLGWTNWEIVVVPGLTIVAIVVAIKEMLKKRFTPLLILLLFVAIAIFIPFEYIYGVIDYKIQKKARSLVVEKLNSGEYDSLLKSVKYPENGVKIDNTEGHVINLYSDSRLQLIFFFQTYNREKQNYCGILYISNEGFLKDRTVQSFLYREVDYKKLDNNWYWIKTYEDIGPGP
jgi:hypothetical protein